VRTTRDSRGIQKELASRVPAQEEFKIQEDKKEVR
jgi:hypothetical protein